MRFEDEPEYQDALFRQKRKKGKFIQVAAPELEAPVADTHAHVHLLPDPVLELARCAVNGIGFVCCIVDAAEDVPEGAPLGDVRCVLDAVDAAAELAAERAEALPSARAVGGAGLFAMPDIRFAVGVHPHNAKLYSDDLEKRMVETLADPRVGIIGEIGLDYHYDFSPREDQRRVFARQIQLARELGLPISLHIREAHGEALEILDEVGLPEAGVLLHCFNLGPEDLAPWLERGCYAAFGGPLTFKAADEVREAARLVPLNRLLTETDAPYMTPEPMRGVRCRPDHVAFTAEKLAEVRGYAPGEQRWEFLEQLMANARGLLDRPRGA